MKTIGLIGGMSWESTAIYYKTINEQVRRKLGGLHSARLLLSSIDFAEYESLQRNGAHDMCLAVLTAEAKRLAKAGADFLLLCSNTVHMLYEEVCKEVEIPVIHIAEGVAEEMKRDGIQKAALLGTKLTMKERFYRAYLEERGFSVIVPSEGDMELLDRIIFSELCRGVVRTESQGAVFEMMERMRKQGAEAVIFGCTEFTLMITDKSILPLYDTTVLHAKRAAELAIEVPFLEQQDRDNAGERK